ncbi:unknown [Clostridium sp. CAG:575]|nr:unknown [Clostridium sp. CAG:575]
MLNIEVAKKIKNEIDNKIGLGFIDLQNVQENMKPIPCSTQGSSGCNIWGIQKDNITILIWMELVENGKRVRIFEVKELYW